MKPNLNAPYFIVKEYGSSRQYWTGTEFDPLFWNAQHYTTFDVAYAAMAYAYIVGASVERS